MKLFKLAFGWLLNRWVISVIGITILGLLIWFLGPMVAVAGVEPLAGVEARFIAIIVVIVIWAAWNLIVMARARKTNQEVLNDLVAEPLDPGVSPSDQVSQEEIEVLRERFGDALATLKKAKLGGRGGRRYLYQLPWYVVIGPPGAGKTTALKNSGLNFPLSESLGQDAVQGVGGTRNCDWWFTDEAVLLDTAGRYTTQDSDQGVDRAAWTGFINLLKKHRRQRPLDGVIVAFSITDLVLQDSEQRQLHARAVRARLQELYQNLKLRVPVYVVLTKCDLLSGFVEYFDDLSREDRNQVWGLTFTLEQTEQPKTLLPVFSKLFDDLMDRLDGRLIGRLEQERDVLRRGLIHGFPQQMRLTKEAVQDFLGQVFGPSRYEEETLLRGVYFSSGTQEGTPIDRLISSVSAAFGLDRQAMTAFSGQGRSYFLHRLLRDVVFREAELVRPTGFFDLNRPWIQRTAYGGATLALLGMAGAWYYGFVVNSNYVSTVGQQVASYEASTASDDAGRDSTIAVLPSLNILRDIPGGYEEGGDVPPPLLSLGLYQGGKLGAAARNAYGRALNTVLLPRVVERLEEQISGNMLRGAFLYEALKVYLMLGIPSRFDRDTVQLWITLDWNAWLSGVDQEAREQLNTHLVSLLDGELNPVPMDANLVTLARQKLAQLTLAERIYAQIKGGSAARQLGQWRITDKLGDTASVVFRRLSGKQMSEGIPGFYTKKGYEEVFLRESPELAQTASSEVWIIGSDFTQEIGDADMASLNRDLTMLYVRDYIDQWDGLLTDLDVVSFRGLAHGVTVMKALAAGDSPIASLLVAANRETKLVALPVATEEPAEESDQLQSLRNRLSELFETAPEAQAAPVFENPIGEIDRRFRWVRDMTEGKGDGAPQVDPVVSSLNEMYVILKQRETTGAGETAPLVQRLRLEAERQPPVVSRWMETVATQISQLTVRDIQSKLNSIWATTVLPFCQSALGERYPMIKGHPEDVNINDFSGVFGPQGKIDTFFESFLRPYVDTTVSPWRLSKASGVKVGLSPQSLKQFESASRIKRAFFPDGGPQPQFRFRIKPLSLDKGASQVLIELGEQRHTYRHGPTRFQEMQWPPPSGTPLARVVFNPIGVASAASITAEGPWSWFRLLDQAKIERTATADRFTITFETQGLKAVYELLAASVTNPYYLPELREFRCFEGL
jgi:type VI secretion system protein ImpL